MARALQSLVVLLLIWSAADRVDAELGDPDRRREPVDEATARLVIAELDAMTAPERAQVLPWIVNAIAQQPDVHIQGQLSQDLDEKLARLTDRPGEPFGNQQIQDWDAEQLEEVSGTAQERASFDTLLTYEQAPLPSEEEIRKQVDALALDPQHPELALTEAMEIAGAIDRIEDPQLQASLRQYLEDQLTALQADL